MTGNQVFHDIIIIPESRLREGCFSNSVGWLYTASAVRQLSSRLLHNSVTICTEPVPNWYWISLHHYLHAFIVCITCWDVYTPIWHGVAWCGERVNLSSNWEGEMVMKYSISWRFLIDTDGGKIVS